MRKNILQVAALTAAVLFAAGGSVHAGGARVMLEGYDELVSAPYGISYESYHGAAKSGGLLYLNTRFVTGKYANPPADKPYALIWKTAAVPEGTAADEVTFVWNCAMTGYENNSLRHKHDLPLDWTLSLVGKKTKELLTFRCGVDGTTTWRSGDVSLTFHMVRCGEWMDALGVMRLTVPGGMVTPGKPLTLRLEPAASPPAKALYILFYDKAATVYFAPGAVAALRPPAATPVINGYRALVAAPYEAPTGSHRRQHDLGGVLYISKHEGVFGDPPRPDRPRHLRWRSAPVPAANPAGTSDRVMLAWHCALTGDRNEVAGKAKEPLEFDVCLGELGERRVITFDLPAGTKEKWTEDDVTLGFESLHEEVWGDYAGLMCLSLPRRMVTDGEPVTLTVRPRREVDLRVFYMLLYNDAVAELFD